MHFQATLQSQYQIRGIPLKHQFRKMDGPKLTPAEASRQGRVTQLACEKMPASKAIAFLNSHQEALGGRPIDLAVESEIGLLAVKRAIATFPT